MSQYTFNQNKFMFKQLYKFTSLVILVVFFVTTVKSPAYAQVDPMPFMPNPGVVVHLSPEFSPAYLKGIVIHPEDALKFDFIIYKGDKPLSDEEKRVEYTKLTKYFLASLAVPDDDQWVNLSPYERDRIIKDDFGKTEMGRDLLAQDYMLKQITASLIYPEDSLGKKFWDRVYSEAQKEYGTTNIPVNTFNKVWILPDSALIYEKGNTAYVLKNHLKVMLEEDYLSLKKHVGIQSAPINKTHTIASKIVREIVLPELEREVNEDENFATVRQVYSGMLLATWYKHALKESLLSRIYADKSKVKGVDQDPKTNEEIYHRYIRAYKKGVFNYIKEDVDKYTNETIPRKYFSGGGGNFAMAAERFNRPEVGFGQNAVVQRTTELPPQYSPSVVAEQIQNSDDDAQLSLSEDRAVNFGITASVISEQLRNSLNELTSAVREERRESEVLSTINSGRENAIEEMANRMGSSEGRGNLDLFSPAERLLIAANLFKNGKEEQAQNVAVTCSSCFVTYAANNLQNPQGLTTAQNYLNTFALSSYHQAAAANSSTTFNPTIFNNTVWPQIVTSFGLNNDPEGRNYFHVEQEKRAGVSTWLDQAKTNIERSLREATSTVNPAMTSDDVLERKVVVGDTVKDFTGDNPVASMHDLATRHDIQPGESVEIHYTGVSIPEILQRVQSAEKGYELKTNTLRDGGVAVTITRDAAMNIQRIVSAIKRTVVPVMIVTHFMNPMTANAPNIRQTTVGNIKYTKNDNGPWIRQGGYREPSGFRPTAQMEGQLEKMDAQMHQYGGTFTLNDVNYVFKDGEFFSGNRQVNDPIRLQIDKLKSVPDGSGGVFAISPRTVIERATVQMNGNISTYTRKNIGEKKGSWIKQDGQEKVFFTFKNGDTLRQNKFYDYNGHEVQVTGVQRNNGKIIINMFDEHAMNQNSAFEMDSKLLPDVSPLREKSKSDYAPGAGVGMEFERIDKNTKGGIDFNSANLNLQIKRDGRGVPLPIDQQDLQNIHIDGLIPVIIDIKPAATLPIFTQLQDTVQVPA